jgi:hypothetical protein
MLGASWSALHESPTPAERCHVRRRQPEPLAVRPTVREPGMPVALDAGGVIGLDGVDQLETLGKLDRKLVRPAPTALLRPIL